MAQTYTSDWMRVSHGDITTHNPQSIVSSSRDIIIQSAEVRWEGVETTTTSTNYSSNATNTWKNEGVYSSFTLSDTLPAVPSGYSFDHHEIDYDWLVSSNADESATISTSVYHGGNEIYSDTQTQPPGDPYAVDHWWHPSTSQSGDTIEVDVTIDPATKLVNYGADGGPVNLELVTVGSKETTTTHYTKDPRVTRDVTGDSGNITLNSGETSSWFTLSGLDPNSEEFYHDIAGSGEAYFQFKFTWEYKYPDAVGGYWNIYDESQNAIHRVALADPADSLLNYNHHRFAVGGNVYALDVVDPSDEDAITWRRWYHPTYGVYCPRASKTIQL